MVTATTALKVMQYLNMAFFIGMTMFPGPFLDGYKMKFEEPAKKEGFSMPWDSKPAAPAFSNSVAILYQMFNIMGIQLGVGAVICGAMSRPGVSKESQAVTALGAGTSFLVMAFNDATYAFSSTWPESIPKDGLYANFVLFGILFVLCFLGWKSSGSPLPTMAKMMPTGRFGVPLAVYLGANMFYVLGCGLPFFREGMTEMFLPGQAATMTDDVKFMFYLIIGNIGKIMFNNTLIVLAAIGAAPTADAKEDVMYRLCRATSLMMMFFLGSFSKDSIVAMTTGWSEDMRVPTFVQNFAVAFYMVNAWTAADFTLVKPTKKVA